MKFQMMMQFCFEAFLFVANFWGKNYLQVKFELLHFNPFDIFNVECVFKVQ
jgi:hypothetical protein